MQIKDGQYKVIVIFTRNYGDDAEVLSAQNIPITDEALIQQFQKELQMGYDDCGMAGGFEIISS